MLFNFRKLNSCANFICKLKTFPEAKIGRLYNLIRENAFSLSYIYHLNNVNKIAVIFWSSNRMSRLENSIQYFQIRMIVAISLCHKWRMAG